jgi:hypothetical protein
MINGNTVPQNSALQTAIMKVLLGNPRMDAFKAAELAYDALLAEKDLVDVAVDALLANSWQPLGDPEAQFSVESRFVSELRESRS